MKYFRSSTIFTVFALIGSYFIGEYYGGTVTAGLEALFIASILAVLEISLSFDNAIVNATVLKNMNDVWRHRFLTWGMLIAVFGMRFVFPLVIVTVMASVNPWEALVIAATQPDRYAELMLNAHLQVSAFGGTFLMMVALNFFYDEDKKVHWISLFEKIPVFLGKKVESVSAIITLVVMSGIAHFLPPEQALPFLYSSMGGLITYAVVRGIGSWLEASDETMNDVHRASAGMFLYLEVLDASFSFDGVVGAFAITHNLFIIMLGLSIGAFFVRSLTIMFVEKDTLTNFEYLEHGAFYAIGVLATIMLLDPFLHIPEWVTGLSGAMIIGLSFYWSLKHRNPTESEEPKLVK